MHLRRALLLFAIVLGLAAIAASVSRPTEDSPDEAARPPAAPTVSPGSAAPDAVELTLDSSGGQRVRLEAGQPGTLLVEAEEPGQVEIPELGLSGFAQPLTPARFDLLIADAGSYDVTHTPTEGDEPRSAGTIVVEDPEP